MYLWAQRRLARFSAFAVAMLFGSSTAVVYYSHWELSDPTFVAWTMLALWALDREGDVTAAGVIDSAAGRATSRSPKWIAVLGASALLSRARDGVISGRSSARETVWIRDCRRRDAILRSRDQVRDQRHGVVAAACVVHGGRAVVAISRRRATASCAAAEVVCSRDHRQPSGLQASKRRAHRVFATERPERRTQRARFGGSAASRAQKN